MRISSVAVITILVVSIATVIGRREVGEASESGRPTQRARNERKESVGRNKKGCGAVKQAWGLQRFGNIQVPGNMIDGVSALRVCTPAINRTCCTADMEEKLVSRSRRDYDKVTGEKLSQLKQSLANQANRFRGLCLDLISNSSRDLHEMFTKTYGVIYEQNSAVFADLFRDLHRYYRSTDLSLTEVLDRFFQTLLQRVFLLLNAHYTFDESYLHCVARHTEQLQPFGDVPRKLSVHLKRAFVAARTFLQGLLAGSNIASAAAKIEPNVECGKAITRMLYCPYCSGLVSISPCRTYCNNVMRGCLAYHAELSDAWNTYIEAMEQLAGRLDTSFSMESVLDPLEVKLSDAIMNLQENSEAVTNKIFQLCGQPTLGSRTRRDVSISRLRHVRQSREGGGMQYVPPTAPPPYAGSPLSRAVHETKDLLVDSAQFWNRLPDDVCRTVSPSDVDKKCWNGQAKGRYSTTLVGVGLMNQTENKEVVVDTLFKDLTVNNLVQRLRLITNKLRQAHNGQDVNWMTDGDEANRRRDDDDDEGDDDGEMSGFSPPELYRPRSQLNQQFKHGDETKFAPFTPPWLAATRAHFPHQQGREDIGWRQYDVTTASAYGRLTSRARYYDSYFGSSSHRNSLHRFCLVVVVSITSLNRLRRS